MRPARTLITLATVAVVCTSGTQAAAPRQAAGVQKIVALGDSLTSGHGLAPEEAYPAVLQRQITEAGLPFVVVNHGVSGDTTSDALRRLEAALAEQPAILIVALGANDGLRGVPVARVRSNIEEIIEAAQARKIEVLLCGMDALPVHGWRYTLDFHNVFPGLADKFRVPLVPFMLQGVFANEAMLQPDFAHPNAAGAAQVASNIWPFLQPLVARVASLTRI